MPLAAGTVVESSTADSADDVFASAPTMIFDDDDDDEEVPAMPSEIPDL